MGQNDNKNLAMACHLLGLLGFLGPLVIWLIKKDESATVNQHGKEALNFQISILIYSVGAWVSAFILIGFLLMPAVAIFNLVMIIIAAIKASNGEDFKYPLCLRLIK